MEEGAARPQTGKHLTAEKPREGAAAARSGEEGGVGSRGVPSKVSCTE
jgi:hypothetical protein